MDWSIILTSSVVGAAVAGVVNLAALVLQNSLTRKRERKQQIWQQKQEDIRELEYHAGYLTEYLSGYQPIEGNSENLRDSFDKIRNLKYRMRKYPQILKSLRDFRNTTEFRAREGKDYSSPEEKREAVNELESRYEDLIQACREELDRNEI